MIWFIVELTFFYIHLCCTGVPKKRHSSAGKLHQQKLTEISLTVQLLLFGISASLHYPHQNLPQKNMLRIQLQLPMERGNSQARKSKVLFYIVLWLQMGCFSQGIRHITAFLSLNCNSSCKTHDWHFWDKILLYVANIFYHFTSLNYTTACSQNLL